MRFAILVLLSLPLLFAACSEKRPAPKMGSATAQTYSFPHSKDWGSSHAEYFLNKGAQIAGTRADCARCHDQLPKPVSLNVTCALKCHQPSTSESREALGPVLPKTFPVAQNQCLKCHEGMNHKGGDFAHFPAAGGLCVTCHSIDSRHFESGEAKFASTKPASQSCTSCHAKKDTHKTVHPALKMGEQSCANCHDPHGSGKKLMLNTQLNQLCTTCHEKHEGKSLHGAEKIGKNCVNCHDPHSADQPRMLKKPVNELCLSCHDKDFPTQFAKEPRTVPDIKKKMAGAFTHSGALGDCTDCHNPHASANDRLLNDTYEAGDGDGDTSKPPAYGLCLKCHDQGMLAEDNFSTNFRNDTKDGDKVTKSNLHNFHVSGMGKSCRNCHDPHGSDQPLHIRETSLDSDQPMKFQKSEKGGTCANACHDVHGYERVD